MAEIPRFVKEMKNYSIRNLKASALMWPGEKAERIERIENAWGYVSRGRMTVREFILICEEES